MGFGALATKSGGGSGPKFMKLLKRSKKTVIYCYIVIVLMFGMVWTGCTGREAEFIAEIRETEVSESDESENLQPEAEEQEKPAEIYVDVSGAVAKPGVFCLEEEAGYFRQSKRQADIFRRLPGNVLTGRKFWATDSRFMSRQRRKQTITGIPGISRGRSSENR